jgi:hypothetical protein
VRASALILGLLVAGPAFAQAPRCLEPDHVSIRDDGPGRAILLFRNSADECSVTFNQVVTSKNGIAVRVVIDPNGDPAASLEIIRAHPQNPGFEAYPDRGEVKDGDQIEIVIVMGMS